MHFLRGIKQAFNMNSGSEDLQQASSIAVFSKELKGLSKIRHLTDLLWYFDRYIAADTAPIDLPHSI